MTSGRTKFPTSRGTSSKAVSLPEPDLGRRTRHQLAPPRRHLLLRRALKLYIDGNLSSSMTASGFTTAGANATSTGEGRPLITG
jgi:hypothetical protein